MTRRLTTAQAIIEFLAVQKVERDGVRNPFFAGCFGIFGHGNVAGIGQALQQSGALRYYQCRNEQAMVHSAAAFAKTKNRLQTMICTTSIGPGATNLVTAAAGATINRLPVLLLPGDIFATRTVAPVLQQLESELGQDRSVNDCLRPISRYWDRINRPEQIVTALPEAMRVLTSVAQTGAVTLALPQDVQAEAFDYPEELFDERIWHVPRPRADRELVAAAATAILASKRPVLIAGGGVHYSAATGVLDRLCRTTGIPVVETQAGKGALPFDHPQALGGAGVTGTPGAVRLAKSADLVIAVGTRLSDFTTESKTAFQAPDVRFVSINVCELDAHKHGALALVADARETLGELSAALGSYQVPGDYRVEYAGYRDHWEREIDRLTTRGHGPPVSQAEVIGAVNRSAGSTGVVVCSAGSLPGDLHKLWRCAGERDYHLEYGYSCMGYEIAGGLGVKMAAPDREVYVMVGDASYLMMAQEIVTAVQEGYKLTVVVVDNHGYASIGGLSESLGSCGYGTEYRSRGPDGQLSGPPLAIDFEQNAASLGASSRRVRTIAELDAALADARQSADTTVIVIEADRNERVPSAGAWWDVPVAEVSTSPEVQRARADYERARQLERHHLGPRRS